MTLSEMPAPHQMRMISPSVTAIDDNITGKLQVV
jgi:hypothetical protein